jgi:hypothetical protein
VPFKFNGTIEPVSVEYVTEKKDVAEPQLAATALRMIKKPGDG